MPAGPIQEAERLDAGSDSHVLSQARCGCGLMHLQLCILSSMRRSFSCHQMMRLISLQMQYVMLYDKEHLQV